MEAAWSECVEQPDLCDAVGLWGVCSLCSRPEDLYVVYTCMLLAPCPAFQLENVSTVSGAYCNWSNSHFAPQGAADIL